MENNNNNIVTTLNTPLTEQSLRAILCFIVINSYNYSLDNFKEDFYKGVWLAANVAEQYGYELVKATMESLVIVAPPDQDLVIAKELDLEWTRYIDSMD